MPGVRVQFGHAGADVVNLSRTGALTHMNSHLPLDSEWPLLLELPTSPVRLTGRVVRCVQTDVSLPGGAALRNQYALAITFVQPSVAAHAILLEICGIAMETGEPTG
jgi:hypothetical protein